MKLHIKNIFLTLGVLSLLVFSACEDDIAPIPDSLEFSRVFSPLGLQTEIENQTTVKVKWDMTKGVEEYVFEISFDNLEFTNIIHTVTLTESDLPYYYDLPAGDSQYSARVKCIGADGVADSKWSTTAFMSLPENLFEGYGLKMDALNAVTLKWKPGKAVTKIAFVDGEGTTQHEFDITAEEAAAGMKSVTGVDNGVYNVNLINGESVRGTQQFAMEGTVLLDASGDLPTAIAAAAAGDVIVLTPAARYSFAGGLLIDKSIKIKGLDGQEMPLLYITDGDRMFQIGENLTVADSIVFENLHINGLKNLNAEIKAMRGIFDVEDGELCDLGTLKFVGCELFNLGRQVLRMRGKAAQTIGLFSIDDCIIYNVGSDSGSYGILSATETETNVGVFEMTHCTVDSVISNVIRYDDATACERVTIDGCTFNRAPYGKRYLADMRNVEPTDGVYITNCIFGNTTYDAEGTIYGFRLKEDASFKAITNCYSTSDFLLTSYTKITESLTDLGVTSDAFWTDPENMDFSFKGEGVKAGDPRWY